MDDISPAELRRRLIEALVELERGETPLAALERAKAARELAESLEQSIIAAARAERVSWSKIGSVYGLTKQGAQQRFGERPRAAQATPDGDDG